MIWSVYLGLRTTISYTLYGSIKTGQFIVATLHSLGSNTLHFLIKLLALLTVIIEDFTIFFKDVINNMNSIFSGILYVCEQTVNGLYSAWQSIIHLLVAVCTSLSVLYNTVLKSLTNLISGIRNVFIFIKQIIVMFGEGVWFIVFYIPNSVISLLVFVFSCAKNLFIQIQDSTYAYIQHLHHLVLDSVFNCYHFLTDVPVESLIGIVIAACFVYIFLQFYSVLHPYIRNKMASLLHALKLKYNQLKSAVNRALSNNNQELAPNANFEYKASASAKTTDDGFCIICQEHPKCILMLPCKHLCLCTYCTPRLMRYTGRCPICRKRINSTMKIFT